MKNWFEELKYLDCRWLHSWWWKDLWFDQVICRLRPRNRWLTKQIPREWRDKDALLEIVVLGCLVHYCAEDGENCFNVLSTTSPDSQAEFMRELRQKYELVTQKLPALQNELDEAWLQIPHGIEIQNCTKSKYQQIYGKVNSLETQIYTLKSEIMIWVITHRGHLWT